MDNKKQIIENLEQVQYLLIDTFIKLQEENSEGKQFDYCTSSGLSEKYDSVERELKKVYNVVYQK